MEEYIDYIEECINAQRKSFKLFIKNFLLDNNSFFILNDIAQKTNVYIFSGVIRDFFIGYFEHFRDLDIVIENISEIKLPYRLLKSIRRNSFGGYKINIGHLNIDTWELKRTWGIIEEKKKANVQELVKTAFFNFSAVAYDYNNSQFVYTKDFCLFLKTKTMDVVYEKNPNVALCIINTLYYHQKYDFRISYKLIKWIVDNYREDLNFEKTQLNHFGKIIYDNNKIKQFISIVKYYSLLIKYNGRQ